MRARTPPSTQGDIKLRKHVLAAAVVVRAGLTSSGDCFTTSFPLHPLHIPFPALILGSVGCVRTRCERTMAARGREVLRGSLIHRKKGSSSWKVSGYLAGEASEGCALVRSDGRASGNLVCVVCLRGFA